MKNKLEQKLVEFFESHPEAAVVFAALGMLFTDLEKATAYCGGAAGAKVITYTREQVEALDDEVPAEETATEETATEETAAEEISTKPPPVKKPGKGKKK